MSNAQQVWIQYENGQASVVFDENDAFNKTTIRVNGTDRVATAERIARLLNADQAGLPSQTELLETLQAVKEWAVIGAQSAFARANGADADIARMREMLARRPA